MAKEIKIKVTLDTSQASSELKNINSKLEGERVNIPVSIDTESITAQLKELKDQLENLKEGSTEFKKLTDRVNELETQLKDAKDQVKDFGNSVEKMGDAGKKGTEGLAGGLRTVGGALKALGIITLLVEVFQKLKEAFLGNAEVARVFEISTKVLTKVLSDLVKFLVDSVEPVKSFFKDLFENPKENLIAFGNAIKENLIERFNSFLDTLGFLSSALGKVFKGDFVGAFNDVKKAGKESVDVFTGVNNSVDKTIEFVGKATDAVVNYTKSIIDNTTAQVDALNQAKLNAAEAEIRLEKLDREAEKLRQIRDDVNLSIQDRIKANNELKANLNEQELAAKAKTAADILEARQNLAVNNTIENQVALKKALAAQAGVLAAIEGQRSEQVQNGIGLQRELNELNQVAIDGNAERAQSELEFTATLEKENTKRLELERKALDESYRIERERLTNRIATLTEGTLAYAQALEERNTLDQQYKQDTITNDNAIKSSKEDDAEAALNFQLEQQQKLIDNTGTGFEEYRELLATQRQQILDDTTLTEQQKTENLQANSEERINIDLAEAEQKRAIASGNIALAQQGVELLKSLGEKNKGIQRAGIIASSVLGIAQIVINTQAANAAALAPPPLGLGPIAGNGLVIKNIIGAAIGVAANIAATAKALSALGGGGGGGGTAPNLGTGAGGGSTPATPSVTFAGTGGNFNTATAPTAAVAAVTQPSMVVKAVVVESDITQSQQTIKSIEEKSTLGG